MADLDPARVTWALSGSPFASVLGTNHAPTSAEFHELKAALIEPQDKLGRLRLEIARAQAVVDGLLSEEKDIVTYIDAHQALFSPIRRLPSEALAEIFRWCMPPNSVYGLRTIMYAPLLMTQVSKHWRQIAIDTPQLWSSLHVHFPPYLSDAVAAKRASGVNLWLERSCTLPISLSMHGSTTEYTFPFDTELASSNRNRSLSATNVKLLMRSLLHFCDRIQHLCLSLGPKDFTTLKSMLPPSLSFDALTWLKLEDYHPAPSFMPAVLWDGNAELPTYAPLLSHMPELRKLEINKNRDRNVRFRALPCDWTFLTDISITDPVAISDLLGLLISTPQLQTLKVGVILSPVARSIDDPVVTLAALSELRLNFQLQMMDIAIQPNAPLFNNLNLEDMDRNSFDQLTAFFQHISCPSLTTLFVSSRNVTLMTRYPFGDIPLFNLESLGLEIQMTPEILTECLTMAENLVSFDFVDLGGVSQHRSMSSLQDSLLANLCPSSPSSSLHASSQFFCSKLRHFRLITGSSHAFPWPQLSSWSNEAMITFITTRTISNTLGSCDIFSRDSRQFSDAELEGLRLLKVQSGLKLRLHHPKAPPRRRDDAPMTGLSAAADPPSPPLGGLLPPFHHHHHPSPPHGPRVPSTLADMDRDFDTQVLV